MDEDSDTQSTARYGSFLWGFLASLTVLIGLSVALNLIADPYGSWQSNLLPVGYEPFVSRIARGELINQFDGQTVLIGNSRTRIGLDPRGPGIPNAPACNLGISGASWSELKTVTTTAMKRPSVREILLCLDYDLFVSTTGGKGAFDNSRFNRNLNWFQYRCNLLFNARCLGDSTENLLNTAIGVAPLYSENGFLVADRRKLYEKFSVARSRKLLRRLAEHRHRQGIQHYHVERVRELGQVIADCRSRGITLRILLHPLHADYMEVTWHSGQAADYAKWLIHLCETVAESSGHEVPLWDFSGWYSFSCEPLLTHNNDSDPRWYLEPSHYTSELGDAMLRRIYSMPTADHTFGVLLRPDNIREHLININVRRTEWLRSFTEEVAGVRQFMPNRVAMDLRADDVTSPDAGKVRL